MDWVNRIYGKEYTVLRRAIWEKGFKGGNIGAEHNLSPQAIAWLDKAMYSYCKNRIYTVLNQVEAEPIQSISQQWQALLTEMYGEEQSLKDELVVAALNDENVSVAAKIWLKQKSED
ncbi:MAG: MerR family transcriptional regulator, partial [Pseudomonadota bacterium]|nr:MerR family transcriptional regulator [Pseudomonadota bacterium]